MNNTANLIGATVQYRKVGTFRVIAIREGFTPEVDRLDGWYECEPIKAPKKVRDSAAATGTVTLWVGPRDVI